MSKVQKVSIALTPELNAIVQGAVESGEYASASEVMREALRFWKKRNSLKAAATEHMRALIQEGIDSGPGRGIDFETLKAELHAEYERRADARRRVA